MAYVLYVCTLNELKIGIMFYLECDKVIFYSKGELFNYCKNTGTSYGSIITMVESLDKTTVKEVLTIKKKNNENN